MEIYLFIDLSSQSFSSLIQQIFDAHTVAIYYVRHQE